MTRITITLLPFQRLKKKRTVGNNAYFTEDIAKKS